MFRRALIVLLAAVLGLAACASDPELATPVDPVVETAETNIELLETTDDIATSQIIDAATGELTTLADTVTGDRAVLVWYWAPD